jgi:pimeloyl-ACP methyl ester carboxylesterase
LRVAGHTALAPDLPYEDPATTYRDRVAPALAALADVEDPVIVGHSLGTGYAPLVAAERPRSALVYLCAAPVGPFNDVGARMPSTREGFRFPPNRADGTSVWDPDEAIAVLYRRLPTETAKAVAAQLKPGASPADPYPLTEQPAVPTSVVYARHDEFFNPEWSRWISREIAGVEPTELDTGHFPMLEAPDLLAELLTRLAPSVEEADP